MQKKTKVILKNIINLIDFNNVILKNYHLKDCDKCQEFANIDVFILSMIDSKIAHNFLLVHANEDYAKCLSAKERAYFGLKMRMKI